MTAMRSTVYWIRRGWGAALTLSLLLGPATSGPAQTSKARETTAKAPGRSAPLGTLWQSAPMTPLPSQELDQLIARELQQQKLTPAPLTTDEQFIRRVTLDLTGELPVPADVAEFAADKDPLKRAKLIDKLLASEEYTQHWARYWRDVFTARLSDFRTLALARAFEPWLKEQFQNNKSWGEVTRAMLTAEGGCRFDDDGKNGAAFFMLSHIGADAATERAAETSRIFLGIQIQCAQCHDHPFDQWKRVQFHELTGYFARVRERPMLTNGRQPIVGMQLMPIRFGEHQMPGKDDPKKTTAIDPRFLDGKAPGKGLSDHDRRTALANAIVDKNNPWFAAAYTNRIWGELMGQSFVSPVDDLGPTREAVLGTVLVRLSGSFAASDYDMKSLFRVILNSQAYQRQIRLGDSADEHLHFAAVAPTRLRADSLWESLVGVLGRMGPSGQVNRSGPFAGGPLGRRPGLEGEFKREFGFDPSLKPDDVEGSIPQALLMMNNPVINSRIEARGTNLLGRILTAYPEDDEALRILYLRALARKPTTRERDRCFTHIKKIGNRAEAFEDILWALVNSTEFQTRR